MHNKSFRFLKVLLSQTKSLLSPPIKVAIPIKSKGNVLLCYIRGPFKAKNNRGDFAHANHRQARIIAKIFSELGYTVWVIDYNSLYHIDYDDFDVLFGFGDIFERSFYSKYQGIRIFYATGASQGFSSHAEALRIRNLKDRKKVLLSPRRIWDRVGAASEVLSDSIICVGNDWTISTYSAYNNRIIRVPVSYVAHWEISNISTDHKKRSNGFLWFNNVGAVHKGLDLVLEATDLLGKDCRLHICGPLDSESDFINLYEEYIYKQENIKYHGFVDVRSETMRSILEDCAFVISPSCSEGGGSSILTCMHSGLIPIVTQEASIDIEDFGISIGEASSENVAKAMRNAMALSSENIQKGSLKAAAYVRLHHSLGAFEQNMRNALRRFLDT